MFSPNLDFVCSKCILPDFQADSKENALHLLAEHAARIHSGIDSKEIFNILQERESLGSTGIGHGLAIPHGKIPGLDRMLIIVARSRKGIPFNAVDNQDVHIIFLLIAPGDAATTYLKVLARVSRLLKRPGIYDALLQAESAEAIARIIEKADGRP